jgi:sugar-specific transcriptional regulator TrmB
MLIYAFGGLQLMKEETLGELGLTQNESKVYLSLLEKGFSTATQIAESSGIHRVNVYDAVNKLKERGLVGEMLHQGRRCYQAAPPSALRNLLTEKEIKLNKILPELELHNKLTKKEQVVQVFEGYDFIRNMFLHFLEMKEDILDWDVPKFVLDQMGKYFQEEIHNRRAKQRQWMYHIYSKEAAERVKFLNTLPYTKARCSEEDTSSKVTTTICGDEVIIQVYYEGDKKPVSILIKNKEIADSYRLHFWSQWERSVKP